MVSISHIQQIPEFLETFPGSFCTIFPCFQILESFSSMESAQSFHYLSRRLHVHHSSQSGNTLLIITRLLCSARIKFTILWQLFSCDQFWIFFVEDWMLLLLTVANRLFNAVCPTKVNGKRLVTFCVYPTWKQSKGRRNCHLIFMLVQWVAIRIPTKRYSRLIW